MTHFSANINRIALLRNSRDNGLPDLLQAAKTILDAGADGITVHPRPDERHIRMSDIAPLARLLSDYPDHEFNIEGNPHRDGVDFVAVILVNRQGVKGGETRVFDAHGTSGVRFTLTAPWSVLLLDDARVIHETTPIQPDGPGGVRDTLVLTYRAGSFQDPK